MLLRMNLIDMNPQSESVRRDLAKGYYNAALVAIALRNQATDDQDAAKFEDEHDRAMEGFQQAIYQFERLLLDNPCSLANQYDQVNCYRQIADETLEPKIAETMYDKALHQMRSLAESNPDVHEYQGRLAGES